MNESSKSSAHKLHTTDSLTFLNLKASFLLSNSDLTTMPEIAELRSHLQRLAAVAAVFAIEYGETQFNFSHSLDSRCGPADWLRDEKQWITNRFSKATDRNFPYIKHPTVPRCAVSICR